MLEGVDEMDGEGDEGEGEGWGKKDGDKVDGKRKGGTEEEEGVGE